MKSVVVYAGIEDEGQRWPDKHSLALQRVAGSNVLGHVLNQLHDVAADEFIVIVENDEEAISAWIEDQLPGLEACVIAAAPDATPLQALAGCRDCFDKEPLLLALGSHIVEASYKDLDKDTAVMTLFTKPEYEVGAAGEDKSDDGSSWAGVCYFRHGTALRAALDAAQQAGITSLTSLLDDLQKSDLAVEKRPATLCLDTGTLDGMLFANARLLGLGYGTEDAIERSYVEDFTVIPPVFLHETAVIENAVIGPFTNVEAGARISNSVVRNSLLGRESTIENAVLDGSFIGPRARVMASGAALVVEEDMEITL